MLGRVLGCLGLVVVLVLTAAYMAVLVVSPLPTWAVVVAAAFWLLLFVRWKRGTAPAGFTPEPGDALFSPTRTRRRD